MAERVGKTVVSETKTTNGSNRRELSGRTSVNQLLRDLRMLRQTAEINVESDVATQSLPDPLQQYLNEIGKIRLFDPEEERLITGRIFLGRIAINALSALIDSDFLPREQREKIEQLVLSGEAQHLKASLGAKAPKDKKVGSRKNGSNKTINTYISAPEAADSYLKFLEREFESVNLIKNEKLRSYKFANTVASQANIIEQADLSFNMMVEHNLRLVVKVAKKFQYRGLNIGDLI